MLDRLVHASDASRPIFEAATGMAMVCKTPAKTAPNGLFKQHWALQNAEK